jgi:hypothetical protein
LFSPFIRKYLLNLMYVKPGQGQTAPRGVFSFQAAVTNDGLAGSWARPCGISPVRDRQQAVTHPVKISPITIFLAQLGFGTSLACMALSGAGIPLVARSLTLLRPAIPGNPSNDNHAANGRGAGPGMIPRRPPAYKSVVFSTNLDPCANIHF